MDLVPKDTFFIIDNYTSTRKKMTIEIHPACRRLLRRSDSVAIVLTGALPPSPLAPTLLSHKANPARSPLAADAACFFSWLQIPPTAIAARRQTKDLRRHEAGYPLFRLYPAAHKSSSHCQPCGKLVFSWNTIALSRGISVILPSQLRHFLLGWNDVALLGAEGGNRVFLPIVG